MPDSLSRCFKQVVIAQAGLLIVSAIFTGLFYGLYEGISIVFGAGLAMFNTILARRSILRSSELAYRQPDASMLPVFSGLIQRLIVFAGGFSAGVIILSLSPLPIVIGFALAQFGYLACRMR